MKRVIISSALMFLIFLGVLMSVLWLLPQMGYSFKPSGGMEYTFIYALITFSIFSVIINSLEKAVTNRKYSTYIAPILALIYFAIWSDFFRNFSDRSFVVLCSFLIATYLVKWYHKVTVTRSR